MPKPKDAKVWNEDLVSALEARHQRSLREGKRDAHAWRKGRDQIESARGDIYQFGTGRIVNLPGGLSKTVQRTCEDVIRGVKAVYPDGHVATNGGGGGSRSPAPSSGRATSNQKTASPRRMDDEDSWRDDYGNAAPPGNHCSNGDGGNDASPASSSANPFDNDHYMKRIKIRGGAYAILMAFHYSRTDVLRKSQICREAQKFCDEEMEANYMAGRPRGAWSGNKTLQDRHLLTERGFRAFGSGGFRDRPHEFSLTRDGRMFVDALLANRPEAAEAARNAAGDPLGRSHESGTAASSSFVADPFGSSPPARRFSPARATSGSAPPASASSARDVAELEGWWPSAGVGERKTFDVGRERRKFLHRRVDSLMAENPGLVFAHGSSGEGRRRELSVRVVAKPSVCRSLPVNNRKRPASFYPSDAFSGQGQSLSTQSNKRSRGMDARENAAAAAMRRLERARGEAKEEEDLKVALAESVKLAKKESSRLGDVLEIDDSDDDKDELMQRAMEESLFATTSKKPKAASVTSIDLSLDIDDGPPEPVFSTSCARRKSASKMKSSVPRKSIAKSGDYDDDIEVVERKETFIDMLNDCESDASGKTDDDEDIIAVNDAGQTTHGINHELVVLIDSRERNRNATPRTLRMALEKHLSSFSGPMSAVWPPGLPRKAEEARLDCGDFAFECIHADSGERHRIGVSVERKRVNDLVQRSYDGDHLNQLRKMQQRSSLAILLIEYDTRIASSVTAYGAQNRDNSDPFDTTVTSEDDIFRLFGRLLLSSENIKFIQSKDEQCTLRAISALGLISMVATAAGGKRKNPNMTSNNSDSNSQALFDTLKNGGIPWRLAKRVASNFGSLERLIDLYQSCSNEKIKSRLLTPIMAVSDQSAFGGLSSTPEGWADAAYRIVQSSDLSEETTTKQISGEGALLLHRELVEDHGVYLSYLHQRMTPEEALDRSLDSSCKATPSTTRYVSIGLTQEQQSRYFEMPESGAFYKLAIGPGKGSTGSFSAITIQTKCDSWVSKKLHVFEFEGSSLVDLMVELWRNNSDRKDFVNLAQMLAERVDRKCKCQSLCAAGNSKIVLVCGLQAALDNHAKKPGYRVETKAVLDMAFAHMMLRYNDLTIIQALRKKEEDRVSVVKQLAMACYHYGLTTTEV